MSGLMTLLQVVLNEDRNQYSKSEKAQARQHMQIYFYEAFLYSLSRLFYRFGAILPHESLNKPYITFPCDGYTAWRKGFS